MYRQFIGKYDDILNVDLRLVAQTDTFKYNDKYNVYEDMSGDDEYMNKVFEHAEKLKIVGVATLNSQMMVSESGILYLPSLITHIIEKSGKTEIVKKQLDNGISFSLQAEVEVELAEKIIEIIRSIN